MVHTRLQDVLEQTQLCRIFTGTSASLEIWKAEQENLFLLPSSAILQKLGGSPFVMVAKAFWVFTEQKFSCLAHARNAALGELNALKNFMKGATVTWMRHLDPLRTSAFSFLGIPLDHTVICVMCMCIAVGGLPGILLNIQRGIGK